MVVHEVQNRSLDVRVEVEDILVQVRAEQDLQGGVHLASPPSGNRECSKKPPALSCSFIRLQNESDAGGSNELAGVLGEYVPDFPSEVHFEGSLSLASGQ